MKQRLNALIRSIDIPFDPFDEKSNRDNLLGALNNIAILIGLLYLIVLSILRGADTTLFIVIAILIAMMILARVGIRRGRARLISILLLAVLWTSVTVLILFFENGLRAPIYIAFQLFLVVYAGLLHSRKVVIVVSVLTIVISGMVAFMESCGIFLTEPKIPDVLFSIIALSIFVPVTGFLITRTLENYRLSITLYKNEYRIRSESEESVKTLNRELELAYETTLEGWSRALELRDRETEGHSRRVSDLAVEIAKRLGVEDGAIRYVYYGALLHDIGKMGVPDEILKKPGSLTPEERAIIHQHPTYAFEMLKGIQYLQPAVAIPYSHHENWDGTGYPQGLQGKDIPLFARIFSVVDNWDALTSDRPYRKAWSKDRVIAYIEEQSGKKFDPQVVEVFIKCRLYQNAA